MKGRIAYILFFILILLSSCGSDSEELAADQITQANILLSEYKCDEALAILTSMTGQSKNPDYALALSSAYACKSKFSVLTFFTNDTGVISDPSIMGSFARFTLSKNMTSPTDNDYEYMLEAVNTLLYAGGLDTAENPTSSAREDIFGSDAALDIDSFLSVLLLQTLGMYIDYYADTNGSGVKGSGSEGNNCFLNYDNVSLDVGVDLQTFFGTGVTGACTWPTTGHSDLGATGTLDVSRMCEGVILLNNFIQIIPAVVDGALGDDFDDISDITDDLDTAIAALSSAKSGMETVSTVTSQELCESEFAADDEPLQVYFAFLFETLVE